MEIMIARRPIGEAPEWVRDAWIGLSLPTSQDSKRSLRGLGVLSGPANAVLQLWAIIRGCSFRVTGYVVNAKAAVDILAQTQPAAAQWWNEHTPALLDGKHAFIFDANACQCRNE